MGLLGNLFSFAAKSSDNVVAAASKVVKNSTSIAKTGAKTISGSFDNISKSTAKALTKSGDNLAETGSLAAKNLNAVKKIPKLADTNKIEFIAKNWKKLGLATAVVGSAAIAAYDQAFNDGKIGEELKGNVLTPILNAGDDLLNNLLDPIKEALGEAYDYFMWGLIIILGIIGLYLFVNIGIPLIKFLFSGISNKKFKKKIRRYHRNRY